MAAPHLNIVNMTEDDFELEFTPVPNHFDPDSGWGRGDGPGCLFGISPEELAFVKSQPANRIWTLLDGEDDDKMYLSTGFHFVNRIGYLITNEPFLEDCVITIDMS